MTDERLICSVLKAVLKSRRKKEKKDNPERLSVLVAGAGFEPTTSGL